jgi:hypothetical protein
MIKITITDPEVAVEAGEWCNAHFGENGWDLWPHDILSGDPKYKFEFFKEQDATMFSLRWAEHS